jgi:DNA primase
MEHEGFSFPEALKHLAAKFNIEVEETETTDEHKKQKQHLDSLYLVNQFAESYFQNNLLETDEGKSVGLSYFKSRSYLEDTIKKFGLGYSSSEPAGLTNSAKEAGYNIDLLKQVRLTNNYDKDFFRERVMFTIHNLSGKPIAFAGRTLKTDKKSPKYVNSPETELYIKSKILYGIYHAKKAIRNLDECILVEGYTDVISLSQAGVENVVASSGTALTEQQIRLVKRFTSNIKLLYDGDAAGIKAASRGLD